MIKPTIGRVVWYYAPGTSHTSQPFPALVAYVHSDTCINVGGFKANGMPFSDTSVLLVQGDGYGNPGGGAWACWMPYQRQQAAAQQPEAQATQDRAN